MRIHAIGTVTIARKTSAIEAWDDYGVVCTDLTTTYGSAVQLAYFLMDMVERRGARIVLGKPITNPTVAEITRCLQEAYRQVQPHKDLAPPAAPVSNAPRNTGAGCRTSSRSRASESSQKTHARLKKRGPIRLPK